MNKVINQNNGKPASSSVGPVENLEAHVSPEWWRGIFNQLYLMTDGDVVEDSAITTEEINLFTELLDLKPDQQILDLCCGQGRHVLEFSRRGFKNVTGLDRSHYLVRQARSRAKQENLAVKFREGDARKLPYESDRFDVVTILGNSFGYFDVAEDDLVVLRQVAKALKPGGRIFLDVTDGNYMRQNFEQRSWEWIDQKHFVCRERSLSSDGQRLISREVITQLDKGVIADQFYAERLYTIENLSSFLRLSGFKDIVVHGNIATQSQRNQDLGMMSHRLMISAIIDKDWSEKKVSKKVKPANLVVVTGDPSLPDVTKLGHIFDEDDFYTLEQMKLALGHLEQYHVTYLQNHDSLLDDLKKLGGNVDLIFNLCDEGYNNEASKELHVPAILELLNLPYTGAGPQCLAYCYDKSLVRGIAKEIKVPVAPGVVIKPEDTAVNISFKFPAILKPNKGDNSVGITRESVVYSPEEALNAVNRIRHIVGNVNILAEKFLTGKDLTCGVIGNQGNYIVLPIAEEDYSAIPEGWPQICGYEAKWLPDSPYWNLTSKPAKITPRVEKIIVESCIKMFERLDCRDYARFDWRLDADGSPYLLEVNPNPGWCWDGHLAKMAKLSGYSYAEMLQMILSAAQTRLKGSDSVALRSEDATVQVLTALS